VKLEIRARLNYNPLVIRINTFTAHELHLLWLFAVANKSGFYEKHGFVARPSNAPGMQLSLNIAE
jgi:hypothetical protein